MYKRLELDSNTNDLAKDKRKLKIDEGRENCSVFGSPYNSRIKERNKEMTVGKYDECISIFKARSTHSLRLGFSHKYNF